MENESRSSSKALIQPSTPFSAVEYRSTLVELTEEQLRYNGDVVHDKRRLNSASLNLKVVYSRRCRALERSKAKAK